MSVAGAGWCVGVVVAIGSIADPRVGKSAPIAVAATAAARPVDGWLALFGWWPTKDGETEVAPSSVTADIGVGDIAERVHATRGPAPRDALVEQQELGARLGRLEQLSSQQRTALVLRYGHDLPVAEVAELLGVELATAKAHLVRGLARLRELMEEHRQRPVTSLPSASRSENRSAIRPSTPPAAQLSSRRRAPRRARRA